MLKRLVKKLTRKWYEENMLIAKLSSMPPSPTYISKFPSWRALISLRDPILIVKSGLNISRHGIRYLPQTTFVMDKNVSVRAPIQCIVAAMNREAYWILLKDYLGNIYHLSAIKIEPFISTGHIFMQDSVIGQTQLEMLSVAYYDADEDMIMPVTKCLTDR